MLRRVGVAISVGLADSLNPSTVGPALYIATGRQRVWRVTQFTIGVFSVSVVGGVVLTIGPGRLLLGLVPHPQGTVRHVIELAAGVVLLIVAVAILYGAAVSGAPRAPGPRRRWGLSICHRSIDRRDRAANCCSVLRGDRWDRGIERQHSPGDRAAPPLQRCLRGPTAGDHRGDVACREARRSMASEGRGLAATSLASSAREPSHVCRQRLGRPRRQRPCQAIVKNAAWSGRDFEPRSDINRERTIRHRWTGGPRVTGKSRSDNSSGGMNDATVRQSASPTPWHPIHPPSSRLARRANSAGQA